MQRAIPVLATALLALTPRTQACPEVTNQLTWRGDGQISQNAGGAFPVNNARAADDFLLPLGTSTPWTLREVQALMVLNWTPTPTTFGLQVFSDGFQTGVGPVPGTVLLTRASANAVTLNQLEQDGYALYTVRFSLSGSTLALPPDAWYWVAVYATGPIPEGGACYFATGGTALINGEVARANLDYPTDPWRPIDDCCIGSSDLAVRTHATQSYIADINCSTTLSVQDIFDYLRDYFAGAPSSDFNLNGQTSVQDLFDFLACYFSACT